MVLRNGIIMALIMIISATLFINCLALPLNESDEHDVQDILEYDSEDDLESELSSRTFLKDTERLWPMGIVPYVIDKTFSDNQTSLILKAMHLFSEVSCVRWVPWTDEEARVEILHSPAPKKCSCQIGRIRPFSVLKLGDYCFRPDKGFVGAVEHEMMHAIGFIHEHQRFDRHCFIKINTSDQYETKAVQDIEIMTPWEVDHSFPYDINSIMHYRISEFTGLNGEPLSHHQGVPTETDIMKINYLYCGGPSYCQLRPDDCKSYVMYCDPS